MPGRYILFVIESGHSSLLPSLSFVPLGLSDSVSYLVFLNKFLFCLNWLE